MNFLKVKYVTIKVIVAMQQLLSFYAHKLWLQYVSGLHPATKPEIGKLCTKEELEDKEREGV